MSVQILVGDCRDMLRTMLACSVQCVVTSPPYFGLRDYGHSGQIGLEPTPAAFVAAMVEVFSEVRRVLRDDGTLWLNLGDSYAGGKQLTGIPWRVAFALQSDGWCLRQDIVWNKPNPMPESVKDRCTKAHEYVFLMSKSERYYFDSKSISEPIAASTIARLSQPNLENQVGSDRVPGKSNGNMKAVPPRFGGSKYGNSSALENRTKSGNLYDIADGLRNRRSVWRIATRPFKGAHFATFPPELPEICINAGTKPGDMVLDPFGGAGTTGLVANRLGRNATLIELNPEYAAMARERLKSEASLLNEVIA